MIWIQAWIRPLCHDIMIEIYKSKISPVSDTIEACTVPKTCCLPHSISEHVSEI